MQGNNQGTCASRPQPTTQQNKGKGKTKPQTKGKSKGRRSNAAVRVAAAPVLQAPSKPLRSASAASVLIDDDDDDDDDDDATLERAGAPANQSDARSAVSRACSAGSNTNRKLAPRQKLLTKAASRARLFA